MYHLHPIFNPLLLYTALREARATKQLNLMRTAHYLLLTQQWTAVEARMLAICRWENPLNL
jgi:hypothetical protein